MYRDFPFFRFSTRRAMEMTLAKADAGIAAHHATGTSCPRSQQDLGAMLRLRLRAIEAVIDVTGHRRLLADNPVLRRSITCAIPSSINLLQVELLRRLRAAPDAKAEETVLVRARAAL